MNQDEIHIILKKACEVIYANCEDENWSFYNLPRPVFVAWAVEQAQGITDNGGFQFFFERDWPQNPAYSVVIEAFQEIGAYEAADCLARSVAQFPFEDPELHCEARWRYIEETRSSHEVYDSEIDILGERVMELSEENYVKLAKYVLRNELHFQK